MATVGSNGFYQTGLSTRASAGLSYSYGFTGSTHINTILPPNGPSCCASGDYADRTLAPPSSYHPGGATILMCDGAVTFISETIDTGTLSLPSRLVGTSPYGVWGALGSKDGAESVQAP